MNRRVHLAVVLVATGTALAGCFGSSSHTTSTTSAATPATTASAATTPSTGTTPVTATGTVPPGRRLVACPTVAQANSALGTSYANLVRSPVDGIGTVCEYTGGGGQNAGVTIFPHQTPAVFAGQVGNLGRAPGMQPISGVGDVGFGLTAGGRSIVNAATNATRTVVAAQSSQPIAATEALARIALAAN